MGAAGTIRSGNRTAGIREPGSTPGVRIQKARIAHAIGLSHLKSDKNCCSLKISMPSCLALSNLLPGFSPTTT